VDVSLISPGIQKFLSTFKANKNVAEFVAKMHPAAASSAANCRSFELCLNGDGISDPKLPSSRISPTNSHQQTTELVGDSGATVSPFPMLDAFMLDVYIYSSFYEQFKTNFQVFCRLKPEAKIRVWRLLKIDVLANKECDHEANRKEANNAAPSLLFLQYQLSNQRFCFNIGREHRSQNVYWMVDLQSFTYVQRCFDFVDCPSFKSMLFALPAEICVHIVEKMGISFFYDLGLKFI
jgi:hypothetical protein